MNFKKLFLAGSAALIAVISAGLTANAAAVKTGSITATALAATSGNIAPYRTQEQIRSYIASHPFTKGGNVTYSRRPDLTSPYTDPGALDNASIQNGLTALNTVRYIAGLSEVTLNSDYNRLCQHAAYICALNGTIDHFPAYPNGVSEDIYNTGYEVCGKSNLAAGYSDLGAAILAYMDDSDRVNISTLGHRRWCLDPVMKQTGFGQVDNSAKTALYYSAMYAFDNANAAPYSDIKGVCWPAQNMPVSYFGTYQAWSYTYGTKIAYPSNISVTLTRKSDGKTWKFSNSSSDGELYIDNALYGQAGCVIFRPADIDGYRPGDEFSVHIEGSGTPVDYTVSFFSPEDPLTAVTGLTASPTVNSVSLSWTKNEKADSYEIEIYKNGEWTYLANTSVTSYTAAGLSADTDYKFRVFALSGTAKSSAANVSTKTKSPAEIKPPAVTVFSASPSVNSITLSWNGVSGADSYQIDVYKNGKWKYLTKTTGLSYTAAGLSPDTLYHFRIFAFSGSEYSASASVSATTGSASDASDTSAGKPPSVTKFSAVSTANSVSLSWNKVSSADKYQVDILKNGKWTYLTKTSNLSYTVNGLLADKGYQFRIYAFNGSAYSKSTKMTVFTKPDESSAKPAKVKDFTAVPDGENKIKFTWSKSADADSYQIDVYKNGKWTYLTRTSKLTYTATGFSDGNSYKFRIFAFKGSAHSASASATVSLRPAAVTGLAAIPSTNSVQLRWKAVDGADSYQIDRYENGKWVYVDKTKGTLCNVDDLSSGYFCYFRVYAFKGDSYSEPAYVSSFAL